MKSSLSGDENVYVRDYARRYPDFPHETTGDQFFSEEQFEVYRALGFHMAHGLLCGKDSVIAGVDSEPAVTAKFSDAGIALLREVRKALGLPDATAASGIGPGEGDSQNFVVQSV